MTRRAQLLAYEQKTGVIVAKAFVKGKLENQANMLRYMAKYRWNWRGPDVRPRAQGIHSMPRSIMAMGLSMDRLSTP